MTMKMVGKVDYLRILDMYPLNFAEFVRALGVHEETIDHLRECHGRYRCIWIPMI